MGDGKQDLGNETQGAQPHGYEPPALKVIGSVYMLTQANPDFCIPVIKKTLGPPDFVNFIPVTNCS